MIELLVIHDLGASGGAPWRTAFAGWPGTVLAPDLPGHGGASPPEGGHQQAGDAVYPVLRLLMGRSRADRVVVGVGRNGAVARLLALGGRASGLVLVDGLGGPWLDPLARDRLLREHQREILHTPEALGPPPPDAPDPRAVLAVGGTDREFVASQARVMPVPTLLVETPRSPTPDADDLCALFPDAELANTDAAPTAVANAVLDWWSAREGLR